MRTQNDDSADKPNLQTIDEQNVTATGDCGDGVGKNPTDANVTEFKCKLPKRTHCNKISRLDCRIETLHLCVQCTWNYRFVGKRQHKYRCCLIYVAFLCQMIIVLQ